MVAQEAFSKPQLKRVAIESSGDFSNSDKDAKDTGDEEDSPGEPDEDE